MASRKNTDNHSTKSGHGQDDWKEASDSVKSSHASSRRHSEQKPKHSRQSSKASNKSSKASKASQLSAALRAKKAALQAEAEALREKEELEKQKLVLEQKLRHQGIQTELSKIEAEQQILEAEDGSSQSDAEEEKRSHCSVPDKHQVERVANWVAEQARSQPQPHPPPDTGLPRLDPQAPSYMPQPHPQPDAGLPQLNPQSSSHLPQLHDPAGGCHVGGLEDMIQALSMPKAELMTFEGDPVHFWTFITAFDNSVGRHRVDEHAKLARLLQYCGGKARKVIESCAAMKSGGYDRARWLLEERFGDRYMISASWVNRVTTGPRVTNETLQDYADDLMSFQETMLALDCLGEVNQQALLKIMERLPMYLQHRWRRQVSKIRERGGRPGLDDLVAFVGGAAKEVSDPVFGSLGTMQKPAPKADMRLQAKKTFHGITAETEKVAEKTKEGKKLHCMCKAGCTSMIRCKAFEALLPEKRFEVAQAKGLCFNCLKPGHSSSKCRAERTCKVEDCKRKHNEMLHIPAQQTGESAAVCHGITEARTSRVLLPIVRVVVTGTRGSAATYALLDSGSTNTFCTATLLEQIGAEGDDVTLGVATLSGEGRMKTATHSVQLSDGDGNNAMVIHHVYSVPKIPVPNNCIVQTEQLKGWDHLSGIPLEMPELPESCVQLLIGQDNSEILLPIEVRSGPASAPYALRTLFGWTVCGVPGDGEGLAATVNAISVDLEGQIERFWKIDGAHIGSESKGLSIEDEKALKMMEQTTRLEDGHYMIGIPFRGGKELPNNRDMAVKRMDSLARKFQKNPALKEAYARGIDEMAEKGYIEQVPKDKAMGKGQEWYLPHHAVISPNKRKIRIVFDCAAKYEGIALNSEVLSVPDLTNRLLGILLRFRQHPVALTADIEAMFLQVPSSRG